MRNTADYQLLADAVAKNSGYFFAARMGTLNDKSIYLACRKDSELVPTGFPMLIMIDECGNPSTLSGPEVFDLLDKIEDTSLNIGKEIIAKYKNLSGYSEGTPDYEKEYMRTVLFYASKESNAATEDYNTLCTYLEAAQRLDMELDFVPERSSLPQEYYIKLVEKNFYTDEDRYWACGGNTGTLATHVTPTRINGLKHNEIFVFGSNKNGHHHAGAAKIAVERFEAKWGLGEGLSGQSYALPTMEGRESFKAAAIRFMRFAKEHQEYRFYVTAVGCGIAGYTAKEVAPWFYEAVDLDNVYLPVSFWLRIKEVLLNANFD